MSQKIIRFFTLGLFVLTLLATPSSGLASAWMNEEGVIITADTLQAYTEPQAFAPSPFILYRGMPLQPTEFLINQDGVWLQFKAGGRDYWIRGLQNGEKTVAVRRPSEKRIMDNYGILNQPHKYVVKLVKYPETQDHWKKGAGRMETYQKVDGRYFLNRVYPVTYRDTGPKNSYGDLKTIGGPVIRYLYRTERSAMNGHSKTGEKFGVYKVSYPMPHDALPYFLEGRLTPELYNKIPVINQDNGVLRPHPKSLMGADILIHTARKGSRGCINVENEEMAFLYHEDLVTENEREIIPLVIYDEDMAAPPAGILF